MEPFAVLIVLPLVVGAIAERMFRDTPRASLAAAVVSSLSVYACLHHFDPTGTWNGLAAFLVAPLAIAFALGSVLLCYGYFEGRRAQRRLRRAWLPQREARG
jgi:peptidoglycan/LPS O-acetylase OafA/YrhL